MLHEAGSNEDETVVLDVRAFIIENFLFGDESQSFSETDSFLKSSLIDSTGILELVHFIEQRFGITVEDEEMIPENLDSLENVVRFVARNRG